MRISDWSSDVCSSDLTHDPDKRLTFTNDFTDADGCDVLITTGALQYLETSLPEMLQGLVVKPTHVLVNMVPLHPRLDYFTLQNMGIAICPSRVMCLTDFVREMLALDYGQAALWRLSDRICWWPFDLPVRQ